MNSNYQTQSASSFRVRLQVSYDGTSFCGWQNQLHHDNKPSIQILFEKALSKIFKETIHCVASGRTDAGVHALEQNIHFTTSKNPQRIPLILALRTLLPNTISVQKVWLVPLHFSASTSAHAKTYRYVIYNAPTPSGVLGRYSFWYSNPLDLNRLQKLTEVLIGRHDFKTFQSASGRPPKSSFRRIYKAQWSHPKNHLFVFEITGNGFLRQMIRNLVSTLIDFHQRNLKPSDLISLMEKKNRRLIGKPAPAQGLFLARVHYPKSLRAQCQPIEPLL